MNVKFFQRTFEAEGAAAASGTPAAGAAGGAAGAAAAAAGAAGAANVGGLRGGSLAEYVEQKVAETSGGQNQNGQANSDQQQNGQQQPNGQQQQQNGAFYPEGLPNDLRGTTDKETIEKLWGNLPKPPATPQEYKFEPRPEFVQAYGDLKDDPVLPIFQEVAHKNRIDAKQFSGMITDFYQALTKAGIIEGAVDAEAEMMKLAGDKGLPAERYAKAHNRIAGVQNFISGLQTQKVITKHEATILGAMSATADSVIAFEKIMKMIPGAAGPAGGGEGASGYSWNQADTDMRDERYSSTSPKYDPHFRKQVDERMARLPRRAKVFGS